MDREIAQKKNLQIDPRTLGQIAEQQRLVLERTTNQARNEVRRVHRGVAPAGRHQTSSAPKFCRKRSKLKLLATSARPAAPIRARRSESPSKSFKRPASAWASPWSIRKPAVPSAQTSGVPP